MNRISLKSGVSQKWESVEYLLFQLKPGEGDLQCKYYINKYVTLAFEKTGHSNYCTGTKHLSRDFNCN